MLKPILKQFLFLFLLLGSANLSAQSFDDLKRKNGKNAFEEDWLKVFVRYTSANSKYTPNYSGFTINVAIREDNSKKWGLRTRYENPTLGDLFYSIVNLSKDIKNGTSTKEVYDDHAHGGGFLGWYQVYLNAYTSGKLIISPGITMGDYIYGSRYDKGNGKKDYDPNGYYFAVGPAIMASYVINKKLWLDGYINYDISVVKVKNDSVDPDYKKPSFMSIGADLNTTYKFFGGFRINKLIDKGINKDNSSRLDISFGMCF
ncbi:hypothetical protein [Pedobacter alpinus]|uniref:Outer membrane protein beta-barrel domain-containing protein n=1 Tax=Pedobacter alpinus TaxID=1590643 RepID=A0ABW5TU75_9SPHI